MKLEDQVVSLALAKEMKELGVPQHSIFGWYQYECYNPYIEYKDLEERARVERMAVKGYSEDPTFLCSAPTVAELGEMLPGHIKTTDNSWNSLHTTKLENGNEWLIAYYPDEIKANTEANARAKMILHLIKEGIIKVEEVGK